MNRSSDSLQMATQAPFLRLVLILVLSAAALAGVLVASEAPIGWLALALSLVAGPLAVVVDGRNRARGAAWQTAAIPVHSATRAAPF